MEFRNVLNIHYILLDKKRLCKLYTTVIALISVSNNCIGALITFYSRFRTISKVRN